MSSILILGASYGSLLATRLALAGHNVCLVCTTPTAQLINRDGTLVRFPTKGSAVLIEVRSNELPGAVRAAPPHEVQPSQYDMCVLGMQESQYSDLHVRQLMQRVARARVPSLAIMNMPPLPYLKRLLANDKIDRLRAAYAMPQLWDAFDQELVTLASPDPQAFRPAGEGKNVLQVGLATNFKAAAFASPGATALLRQLGADIEASRLITADGEIELPVKLKVHDSIFVPLAKWPMLITGNYRCVRSEELISIRDAVHGDLETSRQIYTWVADICCHLGASTEDLVPFERYAAAAAGLLRPSSVARALNAGAVQVERVDLLVQGIASQMGISHPALDAIVSRVGRALDSASPIERQA
jgi:hypothetical protein